MTYCKGYKLWLSNRYRGRCGREMCGRKIRHGDEEEGRRWMTGRERKASSGQVGRDCGELSSPSSPAHPTAGLADPGNTRG